MAGVFVSYRRDDSQGFAGRLADDLGERLGKDRVFRDMEIPIGSDFSDVLHRAIAASDLLLVIIGRRWIGDAVDGYPSRLFEPADWVRTEIEAAFQQGKQVVPILVGGAQMPAQDQLPDSIGRLASLQAAEISDRRWNDDVDQLADRLRSLCPGLEGNRPDHSQEESLARVLGELGERVIDEVQARRRPDFSTTVSASTITERLLNRIWRGVRKLVGTALLLLAVYVGIRLFGDASLLSTLDAFEARLQIGWERALAYLQGFSG